MFSRVHQESSEFQLLEVIEGNLSSNQGQVSGAVNDRLITRIGDPLELIGARLSSISPFDQKSQSSTRVIPRNLSILVAEDCPQIVKILNRQLKIASPESQISFVASIDDAHRAIVGKNFLEVNPKDFTSRFAEGRKFDVVLLDNQMPQSFEDKVVVKDGGMNLARLLRTEERVHNKALECLLICHSSNHVDNEQVGEQALFDHILKKPQSIETYQKLFKEIEKNVFGNARIVKLEEID